MPSERQSSGHQSGGTTYRDPRTSNCQGATGSGRSVRGHVPAGGADHRLDDGLPRARDPALSGGRGQVSAPRAVGDVGGSYGRVSWLGSVSGVEGTTSPLLRSV